MINEANKTVIQEGMTFHIRITLSGVHPEAARSVVAIGDTIIVRDSGNTNLTMGIPRKYSEISYSLEESEEE